MTKAEYQHLLATEGGADQKHSRGYQSVPVTCITYSGHAIQAYTLQTRNVTEGFLPSFRYLKLIRDGSAIHGLHPKYQEFVDRYPGHARNPCAVLFLILLLLLFSPLLIIFGLLSLCCGRGALIPQVLFQCLSKTIWVCTCCMRLRLFSCSMTFS